MAGVGFELKKLFHKNGVLSRIKAYSYSSMVVVGPMLFCMFMILGVQLMMREYGISYYSRQIFISGVIYAFIFSYLLSSFYSMHLTRTIADLIYMKQFHEILPTLYRTLRYVLPVAATIGLLYLLQIKLDWSLKLSLYMLFMELLLIWTLSIYISTAKEYKKITQAFLTGMFGVLLGTFAVLKYTALHNIAAVVFVICAGLLITVAQLWWHVEGLFYVSEKKNDQSVHFRKFRYPSLLLIGFLGAIGLYSHQFIEWLGPNGVWIENSFLLAPRYDVAVYYALLSILPTLVVFVVNFETEFYRKYKNYYDLVFVQGNLHDINQARDEMAKVVIRELSRIMGLQLFFSILFIALGIRFLPMIGFTFEQVDTFNVLVMGFYLYVMYITITVILMYFDDRKGTLWLTILFLVLCTVLSVLMLAIEQPGLSLFIASLITFVAALARLLHMLRHLHYYTFSAQPLVTKLDVSSASKEMKQV